MADQKTLLFISRHLPIPGGGGSGVYAHDLLQYLASRGFAVSVLLLEPHLLKGRRPWLFGQVPGTAFRMVAPGFFRVGERAWNLKGILWSLRYRLARLLGRLDRLPETAATPWGCPLTVAEAGWVEAVAGMRRWDVVLGSYCWLAGAFDHFRQPAQMVILTHDVWHQHLWRNSDNRHLQELDREKEAAYLGAADLVIAITERDAAIFREMVPLKKIVVAPMSCTPRFSEVTPTPGRLLFVGSMYEPNVDGVKWFVREILPKLEKEKPGHFTLQLVGSVCEGLKEETMPAAVVKRGMVADLATEYAQAQMVVVPLLAGTGLKIKVVEAIGHGKTVVTTNAGAQGIESLAGRAYRLAGSAEEFARAILELAENAEARSRLERGAREAAVAVFSPEASYGPLTAQLEGATA